MEPCADRGLLRRFLTWRRWTRGRNLLDEDRFLDDRGFRGCVASRWLDNGHGLVESRGEESHRWRGNSPDNSRYCWHGWLLLARASIHLLLLDSLLDFIQYLLFERAWHRWLSRRSNHSFLERYLEDVITLIRHAVSIDMVKLLPLRVGKLDLRRIRLLSRILGRSLERGLGCSAFFEARCMLSKDLIAGGFNTVMAVGQQVVQTVKINNCVTLILRN